MLMRVSGSFLQNLRKRPPDVLGRFGVISADVLLGNPRTEFTSKSSSSSAALFSTTRYDRSPLEAHIYIFAARLELRPGWRTPALKRCWAIELSFGYASAAVLLNGEFRRESAAPYFV
jgi:hypothetical protein